MRAGTTITDIASIVNGMVSPLRGELTQDENDRIQVSYCWIQGTYYGFISLMSWRELASELREALAHADGVDQEEIRAQIADAEARARA